MEKRVCAEDDGKGKERREAPVFSLFLLSLAHFLFVDYCYFIGIPSRSLFGGERTQLVLVLCLSLIHI